MATDIPPERKLYLPPGYNIEALPAKERPKRYKNLIRGYENVLRYTPHEIEIHEREILELQQKIKIAHQRIELATEQLPKVKKAFEEAKNVRKNELAEKVAALRAELERLGG